MCILLILLSLGPTASLEVYWTEALAGFNCFQACHPRARIILLGLELRTKALYHR